MANANVVASCMECSAVYHQVEVDNGFVEIVSESGERIESHEHNRWELSAIDA